MSAAMDDADLLRECEALARNARARREQRGRLATARGDDDPMTVQLGVMWGRVSHRAPMVAPRPRDFLAEAKAELDALLPESLVDRNE